MQTVKCWWQKLTQHSIDDDDIAMNAVPDNYVNAQPPYFALVSIANPME